MGKPEPTLAVPGPGYCAMLHARLSAASEQGVRSLERPDSTDMGGWGDPECWTLAVRVNWRGCPR